MCNGISSRTVAAPEIGEMGNWDEAEVLTSLIRGHDRLHVLGGEGELVSEEEGTNKGELFKFLKVNWLFKQLPLRLKREELVDELFWVGQEIVVVVLVPGSGNCE